MTDGEIMRMFWNYNREHPIDNCARLDIRLPSVASELKTTAK